MQTQNQRQNMIPKRILIAVDVQNDFLEGGSLVS
jgi:hypothetical protein